MPPLSPSHYAHQSRHHPNRPNLDPNLTPIPVRLSILAFPCRIKTTIAISAAFATSCAVILPALTIGMADRHTRR